MIDGFRGDLFGDRSLIQQALQNRVIVDTPFHDPRIDQMHETVNEHFGRAEQAFVEAAGISFLANHSAEFFLDTQNTQHVPVNIVVPVPQ